MKTLLFSLFLAVFFSLSIARADYGPVGPPVSGGQPTKIVVPIYPQSLLKKHISGESLVCLQINEKGELIGCKIAGTRQVPEFSKATLDAIKQWKFSSPKYIEKGKEHPIYNRGYYVTFSYDGNSHTVSAISFE